MPLIGPNDDDVRKLHAEINQIINQRFLLCTAAITIFGILLAWMIPKSAPPPEQQMDSFIFIVATMLSIIIFSIYILSHALKRTIRILTNYLVVTKKSTWEIDFLRYRQESYSLYSKPQTVIYLIINFVGSAFPYILIITYGLRIGSIAAPLLGAIVFSITELLIVLIGYYELFDNERRSTERWNKLNL
jgi:hypothetical protein